MGLGTLVSTWLKPHLSGSGVFVPWKTRDAVGKGQASWTK